MAFASFTEIFDITHNPVYGWLYVWAALPYGAILGSFLNMAVYRVPRRISMLKKTRSFCPNCKHTIRWYHNVPILSYLLLMGKCAYCGESIPIRYLIVELSAAGLAMVTTYFCLVLNPQSAGWLGLAFFTVSWMCLLAVIFVDMELYLIPDLFTHIPLILGLALAAFLPDLHYGADAWISDTVAHAKNWNALIDSVAGALAGALFIWTLGAIGMLWKKMEAMGEGDMLLMAALGAILGWKLVLVNIVAASAVGAVVGVAGIIIAKIRRDNTEKTITFEESPDEIETGEPWHIALLRRLGPIWVGIMITALFGSWWIVSYAHLGVPLNGDYVNGYDPLMTALPFMGSMMGAFMILFGFTKARRIREGNWIQRNIEETEDGGVKEELTGNYLPFGPALAAVGIALMLYGPAVIEWGAKVYLKKESRVVPISTPFTHARNQRAASKKHRTTRRVTDRRARYTQRRR